MRRFTAVMGALPILASLAIVAACRNEEDRVITPPNVPVSVVDASWSPEGTRLAVATRPTEKRPNGGLYIVDTATWTSKPLVTSEQPVKTGVPRWAPDGDWILFSGNASLYKVKPNGDSLSRLTYGKEVYYSDWSWSDTLIGYWQPFGDSSGIWIMGTDGTVIRRVERQGWFLRFGPGDSLFYHGRYDEESGSSSCIVVKSLADDTHRVVRCHLGYHQGHSITADGETIVASIDREIWIIETNGSELRQLTHGGGDFPDWRPDGGRIVYTKPTTEGGSLWLMDPDGSNRTPIPGWE